jgi:FSR family fosmidomycin resistance protein-like MFS transporter
MLASLACVPVLLAVYVTSPNAVGVVAIALAGACIISTTSISVVMAQDYMPSRLALAASLVIGFTSGLGGLVVAGLGRLADISGLHTVLWALVGIAAAGTLFTALLPGESKGRSRWREETRALPDIAKPA